MRKSENHLLYVLNYKAAACILGKARVPIFTARFLVFRRSPCFPSIYKNIFATKTPTVGFCERGANKSLEKSA